MTKNKKPVIDLHKTHDTTNKVVGLNHKAKGLQHKIAGEMPNGHGFQQGVAEKPIHPVDAKTRAKKVVGI